MFVTVLGLVLWPCSLFPTVEVHTLLLLQLLYSGNEQKMFHHSKHMTCIVVVKNTLLPQILLSVFMHDCEELLSKHEISIAHVELHSWLADMLLVVTSEYNKSFTNLTVVATMQDHSFHNLKL